MYSWWIKSHLYTHTFKPLDLFLSNNCCIQPKRTAWLDLLRTVRAINQRNLKWINPWKVSSWSIKASKPSNLAILIFFYFLWHLKIYGALIFFYLFSYIMLSSMLISAEHKVPVTRKISIWPDQNSLLFSSFGRA